MCRRRRRRGWPPDETTAVSKWSTEIPLLGAGGEPVDLGRTLLSHGFVELPPMRLDEDLPALELTLAVNGTARTAEIRAGKRGHARVTVLGRAPRRAPPAPSSRASATCLLSTRTSRTSTRW